MERERKATPPALRLLQVKTLRHNRRIVNLREWLLANAPGRRRFARQVRRRMRAA